MEIAAGNRVVAEMTKVYVLETGCYEDRGIEGVYTTAEAAMAGFVRRLGKREDYLASGEVRRPIAEMRWDDEGGFWDNDGDWDDHATVTEYELEGGA